MIAASSGNIENIPEEFEHSPTLRSLDGQTIAMIVASNNPDKINNLPQKYLHDKHLKDFYGDTVKDILCRE